MRLFKTMLVIILVLAVAGIGVCMFSEKKEVNETEAAVLI
jgi:uncharacterized membrane protein